MAGDDQTANVAEVRKNALDVDSTPVGLWGDTLNGKSPSASMKRQGVGKIEP